MTFESFSDILLSVYITLLYTLQYITVAHSAITKIITEAQNRGIIIGAEDVKISGTAVGKTSSPRQLGSKLEDDDDFGSMDMLSASSSSSPLKKAIEQQQEAQQDNSTENTNAASSFSEMLNESAEIMHSSSDLIHMRCSKLVGVRSEQNSQLHPSQFYPLFGATWEFVCAGEALNGRMCFGLKSTMLSQAKSFLNFFHEEKSKQIALLIENEQWAQAEVPVDFQRITEVILNSASIASPYSSMNTISHAALDDTVGEGSETDLNSSGNNGSSTHQEASLCKHLIVDGQSFYAVGCLLIFLKMLTDYMQLIDHIPGLTNDVLNRILEILKVGKFNPAFQFQSVPSNPWSWSHEICRIKEYYCEAHCPRFSISRCYCIDNPTPQDCNFKQIASKAASVAD